jgi:hypothetical protein
MRDEEESARKAERKYPTTLIRQVKKEKLAVLGGELQTDGRA